MFLSEECFSELREKSWKIGDPVVPRRVAPPLTMAVRPHKEAPLFAPSTQIHGEHAEMDLGIKRFCPTSFVCGCCCVCVWKFLIVCSCLQYGFQSGTVSRYDLRTVLVDVLLVTEQ